MVARRYEHFILTRLSSDPEKGQVLLARLASRRCLDALSRLSVVPSDPKERLECMLNGMAHDAPTSWYNRPLKWLKALTPLAGLQGSQFANRKLKAEHALVGEAWSTGTVITPLKSMPAKLKELSYGFTFGLVPAGIETWPA